MNEVSEWYTISDRIFDFILNVLPFALPVILILSIIWFIDGLIEYGYWLKKKDE